MLVNPGKDLGSPDPATKLHVGCRIPLDPIAKRVAGSMIMVGLTTKNSCRICYQIVYHEHGQTNVPIAFNGIDEVANVFLSLEHVQHLTRLLNDFPHMCFYTSMSLYYCS